MKFDRVEYYAGFRGEERPLAVYVGGERIDVVKVISSQRVRDNLTGQSKEIFECLLANGQKVKIEKEIA
jgi:hypothetical protein